jgi:hypothetical protein
LARQPFLPRGTHFYHIFTFFVASTADIANLGHSTVFASKKFNFSQSFRRELAARTIGEVKNRRLKH